MKRNAALAGFAAAFLFAFPAAAQELGADSLFVLGRFDEAGALYARRLDVRPPDLHARRNLGLILLWENQLDSAVALLRSAALGDRTDQEAREGLAEAYYRQGEFGPAAIVLREIDESPAAAKLESIVEPGSNRGSRQEVTVPQEGVVRPFVGQSLLPVLEVEVNGQTGHMLLDTGGGETILDSQFADRVAARRFGADSGSFAGGRVGTFEHAAVGTIALGDAVVRGAPVRVQSTRAFAGAAGGVRVDGIIGTTLLSSFRSTIDFGGRTLRLLPRGGGAEPPAGATVLPFWLLGDHFITLEGRAAGARTMLIFDSGLAMPGGAFVPSAGLLDQLGIRPAGASVTGVGGGGAVTVTPFRFSRLELGPLARADVVSVAGAFPSTLERRFGVRIGGLVSHGFFAGQKVTLDFDRMQMIVEGAQAPAAPPPSDAPAGATAPDPTAASGLPTDSLVARARAVVVGLKDKQYDALDPLWSARMRERMAPAAVGASWEGVVASLGAVSEVGEPQPVAGTRQVRVPVRFGRVPIDVTLSFDEAGLVNGLQMQGE